MVTVEAESLVDGAVVTSPQKSKAAVGAQPNCCGVTWSGDKQLFFTGLAIGDQVTVTVQIPADGTWRFAAVRTTSLDYANTVFTIDGNQVGGTFLGFTPKVLKTEFLDVGTIRLARGRTRSRCWWLARPRARTPTSPGWTRSGSPRSWRRPWRDEWSAEGAAGAARRPAGGAVRGRGRRGRRRRPVTGRPARAGRPVGCARRRQCRGGSGDGQRRLLGGARPAGLLRQLRAAGRRPGALRTLVLRSAARFTVVAPARATPT
ncbi:hypothetical protein NKG94_10885 [Micromonospora sp. M12]